jgi:hypothetical protein
MMTRVLATAGVDTPWLAPRVNAFRVALEWKPADLWIGAYFHSLPGPRVGPPCETWHHVWICLVPMLPIHISWHRWGHP